jgi:hypothetical protein
MQFDNPWECAGAVPAMCGDWFKKNPHEIAKYTIMTNHVKSYKQKFYQAILMKGDIMGSVVHSQISRASEHNAQHTVGTLAWTR